MCAMLPFGKPDPSEIAALAHLIQSGTPEHQAHGHTIGITADYGIAVGKQADIVILYTFLVADALLGIPARLWVAEARPHQRRHQAPDNLKICRACGYAHSSPQPDKMTVL